MTTKTKLSLATAVLAAAVGSVVVLSPPSTAHLIIFSKSAAPGTFAITGLKLAGGNVIVTWQGGGATNQLQSKSYVMGSWSNLGAPTTAASATNPITGPIAFYRVVIATNQPSSWARRYGSTGQDGGQAMAVDGSGNVIVAGIFQNTVDFTTPGGPSISPVTSAGGSDGFVAKYSSAGICQSAKRFGGAGSEFVKENGLSIAADGHCYVIASGVSRFNQNGDLLWSIPVGGATVNAIAADSFGNVTVTGNFSAPFDNPKDFGNGHFLWSWYNSVDIFLAKYDTNGVCLWAENFENFGGPEFGFGIALDSNDLIYLTGYYNGSLRFGTGDAPWLPSTSGQNYFIAKMSRGGSYLAQAAYGGGISQGKAISVDDGSVFIGGTYHAATNTSDVNFFVSKFSDSVLIQTWYKPIQGVAGAGGNVFSISTTATGNTVLAGKFFGTYNFGTQSLTSDGTPDDGFVATYSSSGANLSATRYGGPGFDAVTTSCDGYATGYFSGTATINGQPLTSAGSFDGFIASLPQ